MKLTLWFIAGITSGIFILAILRRFGLNPSIAPLLYDLLGEPTPIVSTLIIIGIVFFTYIVYKTLYTTYLNNK
ncbi:hypothetical protein [Alkalicoccobacillus porphyridii]|uniref:Uncharacterized protein n=1 Tax=Alkalicoccobacillus porphyridii TaxID=2597270 RepID=A0A554A3L4_9BACI|nr:hypothetical protein [Alkalicoccobacillus porphyridii]TSB48256.1 hypothetical protein FN960_01505 [Alkalicoccobacillus porphyridii]